MIESCKRCLYDTNHPLGLVLDDDGICSGCRVHEEKDTLDWAARWSKLGLLVAQYRSKTKAAYDCIVPITGGQDSYFILHLVKTRLGLNPLVVTYNKYWNTPLGIRNLANLRRRFDVDVVTQNVNPVSVKKIVRSTLRKFGSVYWHCIAGQTAFPVQSAVRYRVPLVIWGAHQGLEQVGMFSHEHEVEMTRRHRKDHDLMGHEADDLLTDFDVLGEKDIWQYRYPDDASLEAVGVRGIYLGNFVRWDPKAQHERMIEAYDYRTSTFARTFDTYDHVDCYNYMFVHDLLKTYKHGYSKVTDHACREIRHGRMTREQGAAIVLRHQHREPEHLDLFCEWLGVNAKALQFVMDRHRNPLYWAPTSEGAWQFTKTVSAAHTTQSERIDFVANGSLELERPRSYVTIGRGYP